MEPEIQKNGMENKKSCKICNINAQNSAFLISYVALCFKCLKHVQSLSLKHLRT